MNDTSSKRDTQTIQPGGSHTRHPAVKVLKTAGWSVLGIVALCIVILCTATWLLTPERLTALINREASEYFQADFKVQNARFTFWSTFPRLCLQTDSVTVTSRTLKQLPQNVRKELPADCDFLASARSMKGGINIMRFLEGSYVLHDVTVSGLRVNLVAVNDSVNNFDIMPAKAQLTEDVPYFTADSVTLSDNGVFRYYSAGTVTKAHALIRRLEMTRKHRHKDTYTVGVAGDISVRVRDLQLLRRFPFSLNGETILGFRPFRCQLRNYAVSLGNTRGILDMSLTAGGDMRINNLAYKVDSFSLTSLMRYLPGLKISELERINSKFDLKLSARLLSPFRFTSESLPSVGIDADVMPGQISYTMDSGRHYRLAHSGMRADLLFDGRRPDRSRLYIHPFTLQGEGVSLTADGNVTDIMNRPLVNMKLRGNADARRALPPFLKGNRIEVKGTADFLATASFRLAEFSSKSFSQGLRDMRIDCRVNVAKAEVRMPAEDLLAKVRGITMNFAGMSDYIGSGPQRIQTGSRVRIDSIAVEHGGARYGARGLRLTCSAPLLPMPDITALKAGLTAARVNITAPGMRFSGRDIALKATTSPEVRKNKTPAIKRKLYKSPSDSAILAHTGHTAPYITATAPVPLLKIMQRLRFNVLLSAADGRIETRHFPVSNRVRNLSASLTFDSVALRRLDLRSQQTAMRLKGSVGNLREFLSSPTPAPLRVRLEAALDTVNINQLARAYESGRVLTEGTDAVMRLGKPQISSQDTIAMLVPRNLDLSMRLSAKETKYMNLRLYNLGTEVTARDGDLKVSGLDIYSDFGHGALDLGYYTGDMSKMRMDADVAVTDINVVNFFKNFHTLLLMMPQMKNLEGMLSAKLRGGFRLYPDMYIEVPSLTADASVNGWGLTVHQNAFIRRITKMMQIHTAEDLHIADMDVRASVHDNLLELYPFNFRFTGYKLVMEGLNNFDGRLYYHIGVLESPLHFPFGINIEGMFHDPQLRFGGAAFKVKKAREITSDVMERNEMNLVREGKYYIGELIEKAAESDTTDNSGYICNVPDYRAARRHAKAVLKKLPAQR